MKEKIKKVSKVKKLDFNNIRSHKLFIKTYIKFTNKKLILKIKM